MEVSADGSLEWPPVPPKRLRVLSAADWAHWNDHGFVKIPAAVPLANAGTAVLLHRPCTSAGFSVVTAERAHQQINITGVGQVPLAQLDAVVSNTATAATAAVLLHRPSVLFSRWGLNGAREDPGGSSRFHSANGAVRTVDRDKLALVRGKKTALPSR